MSAPLDIYEKVGSGAIYGTTSAVADKKVLCGILNYYVDASLALWFYYWIIFIELKQFFF